MDLGAANRKAGLAQVGFVAKGSVITTQGTVKPYLNEMVEKTNKGGTAKIKPLAP
jgi:hypothetical protein